MMSERKFHLLSAGIIAALTATMLLARHYFSLVQLSSDSFTYQAFVRAVMDSGWEPALRQFPIMRDIPPLLVLMLIEGNRLGVDCLYTGLTISFICTFLTCQGVLCCSFKLYRNPVTALTTAILVCSLPKIYTVGYGIQRDPLFWTEAIWLLYLLLCFAEGHFTAERKARWQGCCMVWGIAILSALAALTRKEGLPLACLAFGAVGITLLKRPALRWPVRALWMGVGTALFLLMVLLPQLCGMPFRIGSFLLYPNGRG